MSTSIKAIAHWNELTKDVKNDLFLIHQPIGTLHSPDIFSRLAKKQIATNNVNGPAFVKVFFEECIAAVSEGYNVVTELCHISIGTKGVVLAQDLGHTLPADQVNLRMNFIQSVEARKAVQGITVKVAEQPAPSGTVIQSVTNPVKQEPDTLNMAAMVLIQGLRIAIKGDKIDEIGVFFFSESEGREVHIPFDQFSPNTPTKLQFVLPFDVTPGEWKVKVATQSGGNSVARTEKVRIYEYPNVITVV